MLIGRFLEKADVEALPHHGGQRREAFRRIGQTPDAQPDVRADRLPAPVPQLTTFMAGLEASFAALARVARTQVAYEALVEALAAHDVTRDYTALVWGVCLDLFFWGVLPDTVTWIGAAIIIASGLYLLRREKVHAEAEHP